MKDREVFMELENKKFAIVEEELRNVGSDVPNSNDEGSSDETSDISPESDYNMSETS
jgi:hypothetical protein